MISLYIHIPFCIKKCNYCDFLSFSADDELKDRYVHALCREIDAYSKHMKENGQDLTLNSVFFGGGTPSLLSVPQMEAVMASVSGGFIITDETEISLECNPGTVDLISLSAFKSLGINRISVGLQSAIDSELRTLGRIHDLACFKKAYDDIIKAGFNNINIDIMSAIPGQTLDSYRRTLTEVVNADPKHISAYSLIIEEGTKFWDLYGGDTNVNSTDIPIMTLPDEVTEREMYYMTKDILATSGYERYEISNYARSGYECRHNNVYWTGGEYIGVGLGASSYYKGFRYKNTSVIAEYMEDDHCMRHYETEYIDYKKAMEEFMFLGLRRIKGISISEFTKRFDIGIDRIYGKQIDMLKDQGLLIVDGDNIRLTDRGIDVSNSVFVNFLQD